MGPLFLRRCLSWHGFCLIAGFCALVLPAVSRAADPVDQLRDALKILTTSSTATKKVSELERKKKREEVKDTIIPKLKTISQLRRAYLLVEWSLDLELSKKETELERLRREIAERLTKEIETAAEEKNIDQQEREEKQLAIAILIAEIADNEKLPEREKKKKFARNLTDVAIKLAKQDNLAVRQAALHALGKITPDPNKAIPIVEATLKKKDEQLGPRRLAAYALTDLVKNAPHLETDEMQETIRKAIGTAAGDSEGDYALGDDDEWVRGYCLQAIQECAKVVAEQLPLDQAPLDLAKKTLNPDLQKTLRAFNAINPQLLEALKDKEPKVRLSALQALEQIGMIRAKIIPKLREISPENDAKEFLNSFFKSDDPLAGIVGDLEKPLDPQKGFKITLQSLLTEDDVRVRRGAIDVLELLGDQAVPAIEEVTRAMYDSNRRDKDRWVRLVATRTVRNLPPEKVDSNAVGALANLLLDGDSDLSAAAAEAIAALGPTAKATVNNLGIVIADGGAENRGRDAENRVKAMKALVSIGGPAAHTAIPKVLSVLKDSDVRVRRQAAETLGRLGRPDNDDLAKEEIAALKEALRDEDAEVRLSASEAILSIGATK
jgi:HEAT repeat protein